MHIYNTASEVLNSSPFSSFRFHYYTSKTTCHGIQNERCRAKTAEAKSLQDVKIVQQHQVVSQDAKTSSIQIQNLRY